MSHLHSTKKLQSMLAFAIESKNIGAAMQCVEWIEDKNYKAKHPSNPQITDLLKESNIKIMLINKSKKLIVTTQTKSYAYALKINTSRPPALLVDGDFMQTEQYLRLTAVGFTTKNYRKYNRQIKDGLITVNMHLGKIDGLFVNNEPVNSTEFDYHTEQTKLIIRKGLTTDDRKIYRPKVRTNGI